MKSLAIHFKEGEPSHAKARLRENRKEARGILIPLLAQEPHRSQLTDVGFLITLGSIEDDRRYRRYGAACCVRRKMACSRSRHRQGFSEKSTCPVTRIGFSRPTFHILSTAAID